jgi:hypothetical protein
MIIKSEDSDILFKINHLVNQIKYLFYTKKLSQYL